MKSSRVHFNRFLIYKRMTYLNDFHKSSIEKSLKEIEERKKLPINANAESMKHFEMHKKLAELYPDKKELVI